MVNSTALVGHQQMYLDITIPAGGYLYTYVANEANVSSATSVYFDDFTIVHTRNTPTLQVLQTNDYYPFGLQIAASTYQKQTALDNDYLYNGKELQDEHNLGWLDYGARMYMSDLGRWGVVDGMAEKYFDNSVYHYAGNNPISNLDIDGNQFTNAAWGWVLNLLNTLREREERLENRIDMLDSKIAGSTNTKKTNRLNNRKQRTEGRLEIARQNSNEIFSEVMAMESSDQVYDIIFDSNINLQDKERAATVYDVGTRHVNFVFKSSSAVSIKLFAHELKHGFQFEDGSISLQISRGNNYYVVNDWLAYDMTDEEEAYQRQKVFGSVDSWQSDYRAKRNSRNQALSTSSLTVQPYARSPHADLQALANDTRMAFRINNQTYAPNR